MNNLESTSVITEDSPPKVLDNEQPPPEVGNLIESDVEMVPPDGGWGWMIVGGSFLIMCVGTFPISAFSIIFSPILMPSGVSSTKTAWIFNLFSLIWSCYTIFIGPLCEHFGTRKMAIFGGIANFLSIFLSAFAPTPDYLFFTYSFPAGIGAASAYAISFIVVSSYFKKNRGFAVGITMAGSGLSTFLAPIISNYLLENYGYTSAAIICGTLVLNQCVGASLYQPVKWHMKPIKTCSVSEKISKDHIMWDKESEKTDYFEKVCEKSCNKSQTYRTIYKNKKSADKSVLRSPKPDNKFIKVLHSTFYNFKSLKYMRVHFISWSYFCLIFASTNFQLWLPFVITSESYSLELAAWCSSLSSIGNLIGQILMSFLSDRKFFNVIYGLIFGQFLMGSSIIAFSLVKNIKHFMIITCLSGFSFGFAFSLSIPVMIKVMGVEMFPAVLGISSLCKGLSGIIFGPLIGSVRDATQSYEKALWILGGFEFIGSLLILLLPFGEKFDKWNMRRLEIKRRQSHNC